MKPSQAIKSISYLKTHAAEIIRSFSEAEHTLIITQNGEAKAILQDIKTFEEIQESLALLKILAQSSLSLQQGRMQSVEDAFESVNKRIKSKSK